MQPDAVNNQSKNKSGHQSIRLSFEFFPPKTPENIKHLLMTASSLGAVSPDFFSVTFGAGGSTREGTLETVKQLQQKITIPVAPHLSCLGSNRKDLVTILQIYKTMGLRRVVALRGDLPSGVVAAGDFKYAVELVKLIREISDNYFHIEVAAYPETHPQAKNASADLENLKRKFEAGANSALTQYFFNPDAYFYFVDECAKHQIFMPVVPGIMPIIHFNKLMRFSDVCGAEIPRWLYKRLEAYGDDIASVQAFGLEVVSHLCERLLAGGAPGLHFYTLNQAELSLQLIKRLGLDKLQSKKTEIYR